MFLLCIFMFFCSLSLHSNHCSLFNRSYRSVNVALSGAGTGISQYVTVDGLRPSNYVSWNTYVEFNFVYDNS